MIGFIDTCFILIVAILSPFFLNLNRSKNEEKSQNLEILYNQIQIPVLVSILFFLFQLPIIRQDLFKILPSLYSKDGNPNLFGYVLNSAFFGMLFFLMVKGLEYVQDNI